MRYSSGFSDGDRQLLYDLTNLKDSEIRSLEENISFLSGEFNVSNTISSIYHELTDTIKGKGEKQKQWNELGSDQIISLWASSVVDNLDSMRSLIEFDDEMEEAYDNILSTLLDII